MTEKLTIGIQLNKTSPYRVLGLNRITKPLYLLLLLAILAGLVMSIGGILKWAYNKTSFTFYQSENKNLKQELDVRIDELQQVIIAIEHFQNIETNIKIRYGIENDKDLYRLGTGGIQSSEELFVALTDPLENKFLHIREIASSIDRNMKLSRKNLGLIKNYMNYQKEIWQHTPYILPTEGRITSKYGMRIHPIKKISIPHRGIDIAGYKWTPVYASASGRVVKSYISKSYGNLVVVEHGNGYVTKYAHLAQRIAKEGALLERYEILGYLGESGHATGPHLHYEVHRDNTPRNPVNYILPEGVLVD